VPFSIDFCEFSLHFSFLKNLLFPLLLFNKLINQTHEQNSKAKEDEMRCVDIHNHFPIFL